MASFEVLRVRSEFHEVVAAQGRTNDVLSYIQIVQDVNCHPTTPGKKAKDEEFDAY